MDAHAHDQDYTEWCWAASISTIFDYYSHPVTQERIVEETWGEIVNMPAAPQQIIQDIHRNWVDDNQSAFQSGGDIMPTNIVAAANDLAADRPLLICTSHHAMVLTGLIYDLDVYGRYIIRQAIVRDPWPLNENRRALPPQEWADVRMLVRVRVS